MMKVIVKERGIMDTSDLEPNSIANGGAGEDSSAAKQQSPPLGGVGVGPTELGLYIHIPFCKSKCFYCDFNSFSGKEEHISEYFEALKREIILYSERLKNYKIKTVFIGGGTPSLVDARHIYETINLCKQKLNITSNAEISIESNPGTLTYEKLMTYKEMGINRLSIGLQCWQNHLLKEIGRIHSIEEFIENFNRARKVGFKNINVDLIFGLPAQTLENWIETIANVTQLKPEHISCYSLKIEENTVFGDMLKKGELLPATDELDRDMYSMTIVRLAENGYKHYEISNFAKDGYECKHNLIYWEAEPYIGIGAGAHSYFNDERYNNAYDINDYAHSIMEQGITRENIQEISKKESMSEYIILGLRLVDGISIKDFKLRYDMDIFNVFGEQIRKLIKKQLLELEGDRLKLSRVGLDLANIVFVEFI